MKPLVRVVLSLVAIIFLVTYKPRRAKAADYEDVSWLNRIELSPTRPRNRWSQETPGMEQGRRVASVKREERRQRRDEVIIEQSIKTVNAGLRRFRTRISKYSVEERWRGKGLSHSNHMRLELRKAKRMVSRIHPRLLERDPLAFPAFAECPPALPLYHEYYFEKQHQVVLDEIKSWTPQSRANQIMQFDDLAGDEVRSTAPRGVTMLPDMGEIRTNPRGPEPTREERLGGTILVDEEERVRFLRDKIEREPTTPLPISIVYATSRDMDSQRQLARSIKLIEQIVEEGADGEPGLLPLATERFIQAQNCRLGFHKLRRYAEMSYMAYMAHPASTADSLVKLSWTENGSLMKGDIPVHWIHRKAYDIACIAEKDQRLYKTLRDKTHEAAFDARLTDIPSLVYW